ncbi:hypothetical protein PPACK8108_LOCUS1232 [Phakopsora pachyrhizi]|uniref:Uncharacterized protein n=1 Tax=Phakopsora pachyrhizi TaxID=170000 RepID=A0AAV0AFH6_PHAPC|nr:hypothetical protein PPACK8108_LOCUS1232 [Phakopsora pachyrhizi]
MEGAAIVAIALSIEQSVVLVLSDIVAFKIRDVVPSDCWLYDAINVSIDQAALNVALAVGAQQLAKYKDIVPQITAVEELAGVTILCSDKTGTLTTNKLTIDKSTFRTYADYNAKELTITKVLESQLEGYVEEFAQRGLRGLAVAYKDVPSGQVDSLGNVFELIGLLSTFDPPCDDTKQTIDDAIRSPKALNGCNIFDSKVPAVKIGYVKVPVKQLAYEALAQMIGTSGVPLSQQVFGGNIQDYQSNLGLSLLSNDIGTLNGLPLLNNPELAMQVLLAKELAEEHGEEDDQAVKKDLEKDQAETD